MSFCQPGSDHTSGHFWLGLMPAVQDLASRLEPCALIRAAGRRGCRDGRLGRCGSSGGPGDEAMARADRLPAEAPAEEEAQARDQDDDAWRGAGERPDGAHPPPELFGVVEVRNGFSGASTPRNSPKGPQPCRTSYTRSLSAGTRASTSSLPLSNTAMACSPSLNLPPKRSRQARSPTIPAARPIRLMRGISKATRRRNGTPSPVGPRRWSCGCSRTASRGRAPSGSPSPPGTSP
jgi:hypothetical protein